MNIKRVPSMKILGKMQVVTAIFLRILFWSRGPGLGVWRLLALCAHNEPHQFTQNQKQKAKMFPC